MLARYSLLWIVLRLVSLLFAVSVITFWLVHSSPFDPVSAYVGADAMISHQQLDNIATYWGLHQPPLIQYLTWLKNVLSGDFGTSLLFRQPVIAVIAERLSLSLILMMCAWLLSGLFGLIFGVLSGVYQHKWIDKVISFMALLFASVPVFWLGLLSLSLFAVYLNWLPLGMATPIGTLSGQVSWTDKIHHLILPVLVLSITGVSSITLHTKAKIITILESDYLRYAKARGEPHYRAIYRHGIRNIILPALTLQFASISELFGGSILVEQVFGYRGLGSAAIQAGLKGDIPLLLGAVLCSAILIFIGNFSANLCYQLIDPRIKGTT